MPLLQITEPNTTITEKTNKLALGIDLGTTNSLVAVVIDGQAQCLADEQQHKILPSVVHYQNNGNVIVGNEALKYRAIDPANTIVSVKRLIGRNATEVTAQDPNLPYQFVPKEGMLAINTCAGIKSPVEISAKLLMNLAQRSKQQFKQEIFGAVITVPAYFDEAQRQSTKDAAKLAGINVLRLINEPTAAAVAYGLENNVKGVYAIFDLGGGTFDISILRLTDGVFEVIATAGNTALGGDDYDRELINLVVKKLNLTIDNDHDWSSLAIAARKCKEQFTQLVQANNSNDVNAIFNAQLTAQNISLPINYQEFINATNYLTEQTITTVTKALQDAKLTTTDINGVVMVGGSTRMPLIQQQVTQFFNQQPLINLNPDEVVALGAARQANKLAGNLNADEMLLLDVIPLSLGIETMGGLVDRIVPRNSTIPTAMAKEFTTYKDGQTAMAIHVVQGERDLVNDCRSLARFELRGIPAMTAGAARILVSFIIDADGLLQVTAQEKTSGIETSITVKPSYGLTDEEITKMLQDSINMAEQDLQARILAEARLDANQLIDATINAINQDSDLLSATELEQIQQQLQLLRQIVEQDDAKAIENANKQLASITEPFAAKRMNKTIQQTLTGQNIDQL